MLRRDFLIRSGAAAGLSLMPLGRGAFAAINPAGAQKKLIVIFMRGAADGLNIVVPHADRNYYEMRPTIAIPRPGQANGALDLDGYFGLHPALAPVMPMWKDKSLAFVHASGSPDESRSHFDAQDYMESGTPGVKTTPDGWMNRLLGALPKPHSPTEAVSFGPVLPRILSGPQTVATVGLGQAATRPMPTDHPAVQAAFASMYSGDDALDRAYREGQTARKTLMADLKQDMMEADNGAPSPDQIAKVAGQVAQLIRDDKTIELAFFSVGGWDTHVNQGSAEGQLANHLKYLGAALGSVARGLGPVYRDTTIIVMSEFGRTAHENGNGGTDHGHGNAMWILGGPVAGGKVYGDWKGLDESALHENRDVPVTTDFRSVIAPVLTNHMGLDAKALARIFPEAPIDETNLKGLVRA